MSQAMPSVSCWVSTWMDHFCFHAWLKKSANTTPICWMSSGVLWMKSAVIVQSSRANITRIFDSVCSVPDKLFSTVGEQQEGCMIGAVSEPKILKPKVGKLY